MRDVNQAIRSMEEQSWVQPLDDGLTKLVDVVLPVKNPLAQRIKDTLHGTWLSHPLHPVLTDVPVGAWTAACALDGLEMVTGERAFGTGADTAIGLGLAAALPTAASGLVDWKHISGRPRRLGILHAFFNITAVVLYLVSLLLRRAGARGMGRVFALGGYATITAGAYIGGDLVYVHKIGVDHASNISQFEDFVPVLAEAELEEGQPRRVSVKRTPIMLLRQDGRIFALANTCGHLGGPLNEGTIHDCSVTCPWHGSVFSLVDGRVIHGPAAFAQPAFETRVRDGQIEVRALPRL